MVHVPHVANKHDLAFSPTNVSVCCYTFAKDMQAKQERLPHQRDSHGVRNKGINKMLFLRAQEKNITMTASNLEQASFNMKSNKKQSMTKLNTAVLVNS